MVNIWWTKSLTLQWGSVVCGIKLQLLLELFHVSQFHHVSSKVIPFIYTLGRPRPLSRDVLGFFLSEVPVSSWATQ